MGWTKKQLIDQALDELGLSNYTYDVPPEQYATALSKLDAMLATWTSSGVRFSYNLSSEASTNLNQDSAIPDFMNEPVYLNLAVKIAPSYGKTPSLETKANAKQAYQLALRKLVVIPEAKHLAIISGAGNRNRFFRNSLFIPESPDNIAISNSTDLE